MVLLVGSWVVYGFVRMHQFNPIVDRILGEPLAHPSRKLTAEQVEGVKGKWTGFGDRWRRK
jgi:hypothetical protein